MRICPCPVSNITPTTVTPRFAWFARGLMRFFRPALEAVDAPPATNTPDGPTQEVLLSQNKVNVNTSERDWTQAFVRIRPGSGTSDSIDIYEYYWAPVITGRVCAVKSLQFLIGAGPRPSGTGISNPMSSPTMDQLT